MDTDSHNMRRKRTDEPRETLVVLAGTARKNGRWHSTLFERDGDLGDRLRVEAAWYMYGEKERAPTIVVSGGRGKLPVGAPPVADVLCEELTELGVDGKDIVRENVSGTTYEQLCACIPLMVNGAAVSIISNGYHVPRIRALVEYMPKLSMLKRLLSRGQAALYSAETVVIAHDEKRWRKNIETWYRLPIVKKIIRSEEKGVEEIKSGSYVIS